MPSPIVFWDVDTQVDFIDPNGKLYVPGAEAIVPNLRRLTEWAGRNQVLVIASACAHHEGDPEFAQYPPHCLAGTPGQQKIPETQLPNAIVVPNRPIALPAELLKYQQIILEKQELDVFSNPNTEAVLSQLGPLREIILYGVVSEICVACAARGLLQRGYRLRIIEDAVRHLDEAQAQDFLDEVRMSGGSVVTTGELILLLTQQRAA